MCEVDVCVLLVNGVGCEDNDNACSGYLVYEDNVCVDDSWSWFRRLMLAIISFLFAVGADDDQSRSD